jgi:hypothetical protein
MRRWLPLLLISTAFAQQAKKAPPAPPPPLEPPQPVLAWMYPAGGQRGHTVEITASGTGIAPQKVVVTGDGITTRVLESKDPKQARFAVTIAPDASLGVRELRVLNAGGVSNRFRFVVGDLPEINEVEPNSDRAQPQPIASLPVTINGQIMEGDRDYFRFHARASETLVCEVTARSLLPFIADAVPGWFDPVLAIYNAAGKQIAFVDDFRVQPDPVMFFHAPQDGDYTIEVRDVIYRGRGDFVYRLTIGAVPYVTDIFPLGGRRGTNVTVELHGVNLPARTMDVKIPSDAPPKLRLTANGRAFAASDLPSVAEVEPNDTPAQAQRVTVPAAIDGRIGKPGDSDYYVFAAKKGERLLMEVQARRLDSPLDSILTLYNARHDVLAENDDWTDPLESLMTHHADSRIVYTFPAAGEYFLRVRDVQGKGGLEYAYRLAIAPPQPDFTLRITPDNPRLGQGDTAAITVTAVRRDEFAGDISLSVEGLPAGFIASDALIPAGQNEGRLTITAPPDAPLSILAPVIVGRATVGKETITRRAESAESMMQAFAYIHILPTSQLFLAVVPAAAFTLAPDLESGKALELKPESDTPVTIRVRRNKGANGAVSFTPVRIAGGAITTKSVQAAADKDEAIVTLTVSKDAKPGLRQDVIISGVMRANGQTITRFARAIPVVVVAAQK